MNNHMPQDDPLPTHGHGKLRLYVLYSIVVVGEMAAHVNMCGTCTDRQNSNTEHP
jgi:hypothetical protein